ncbi:MAG: excinuclease ABC subunit UvrA [Candidatus Oxydemutatoraceae bacterium WSBS_2016_MAG_OTU14]
MKYIHIQGARTHNLKNIDVRFPRNKFVIITGLSGSGKSSLAFSTLFAEGQRRYVESLSAYARQFLMRMEKPDVDQIDGLSPAIAIEQKSTSHNPRSTVGTITEIYDYLRLLYARAGTPQCPTHKEPLETKTIKQMVDEVMQIPSGEKILLLAPVVRNRKGEFVQLLHNIKLQGFTRARIDGDITELDALPKLDLRKNHTIEVVVDRLIIKPDIELRLSESIEVASKLSDGIITVSALGKKHDVTSSLNLACSHCGFSMSELEPRLFSFNSPVGACTACDGLGVMQYIDPNKIVHDPELTLSQGAIAGWGRRNRFNFRRMRVLAKSYGFDLDTPFKNLNKKTRDFLLHGDNRTVDFTSKAVGYKNNSKANFPGILILTERRFHEATSEVVHNKLGEFLSVQKCTACLGTRLNEMARNVFIAEQNLPFIANMTIENALKFFTTLKLSGNKGQIAEKIIGEISQRLTFLSNVGLEYLTLSRSAETLSGGEAQRIRLASQIGSGLTGVMYILDEPSIGLHQRDNQRLLQTLEHLRDLENTVVVIEHDEEAIRCADYIIDIGPGAGKHGGHIVAQGTAKQIMRSKESLTGRYLSGEEKIEVPKERHPPNPKQMLQCIGLSGNNLKDITAEIPLGLMVCVTGVSGSGKSTFINETLYKALSVHLNNSSCVPAPYKKINGLKWIDKVIDINQSPIGRTPRSNPATYTGLFTPIRDLFASVPESRSRGYKPGRFSFNVPGGRCEACQGDGLIRVEMHFLPDLYVKCDQCNGKRYNPDTLSILYKGKNIDEVLKMNVEQAHDFFKAVPVLFNKLKTLMDVGLSYISLGQSSTTLSGGEAQRIKLSRELSKRGSGKTMYILDEPTTGLHFHDIKQLLKVLMHLRDQNNTIVVIEHNMDVIKTADWIIDLGPEGGDRGGKVIATGTPEEIAKQKRSYTGTYLKKYL